MPLCRLFEKQEFEDPRRQAQQAAEETTNLRTNVARLQKKLGRWLDCIE